MATLAGDPSGTKLILSLVAGLSSECDCGCPGGGCACEQGDDTWPGYYDVTWQSAVLNGCYGAPAGDRADPVIGALKFTNYSPFPGLTGFKRRLCFYDTRSFAAVPSATYAFYYAKETVALPAVGIEAFSDRDSSCTTPSTATSINIIYSMRVTYDTVNAPPVIAQIGIFFTTVDPPAIYPGDDAFFAPGWSAEVAYGASSLFLSNPNFFGDLGGTTPKTLPCSYTLATTIVEPCVCQSGCAEDCSICAATLESFLTGVGVVGWDVDILTILVGDCDWTGSDGQIGVHLYCVDDGTMWRLRFFEEADPDTYIEFEEPGNVTTGCPPVGWNQLVFNNVGGVPVGATGPL